MVLAIDPEALLPSWSPRWDDVTFDHTAAAAVVTALRAVNQSITNAANQRVRYAEQVPVEAPRPPGTIGPYPMVPGGILLGWRGPHRERWEPDYRSSLTKATALHQRINALITSINNASAAATTEQAKRVADRDRWQAERDERQRKMQAIIARERARR